MPVTSRPTLTLAGLAVVALVTGCGQRTQRTDLAITPLPTPIVPSVLVDLRPEVTNQALDAVTTAGGVGLGLVPIVSAFAPSMGGTNGIWTNPETGVPDRTDPTGRVSLEATEALTLDLVNEFARAQVAATVYKTPAEVPSGVTPTLTISGTVGERIAWRMHHSGFGALWYTPAAIFPHSSSSVELDADIVVSNAAGQVLLDAEIDADDVYLIHLFYWNLHARRNAPLFARTVLATEVAQEIVAETVKALGAGGKL